MKQILQYEIFQICQALKSTNFLQRVSTFGQEECQLKEVNFDMHLLNILQNEKKSSVYPLLVNIFAKISQDQTGKCLGQGHGVQCAIYTKSRVTSI